MLRKDMEIGVIAFKIFPNKSGSSEINVQI